ncbi:hypothetical protein BGW39_004157 [Mortierella sp. 14UC]|nr:hypothetical protein BGW39_004157 [Mortierella sp. 14UC]
MQQPDPPQGLMQAFRSVCQTHSLTSTAFTDPKNRVIHIDCHLDPVTQEAFVLWDDIQQVFDDALYICDRTRVVPFLKGSDFKTLEPHRIAAVPDVVLDVIVDGQLDNNIDMLMDAERPPPFSSPSEQEVTKEKQDVAAQNTIASLTTGQHITRIITRASRGDEKAQIALGDMYWKGKELCQDYQKAMDWYMKAAEQGHPTAQRRIGSLYKGGLGVTQDYTTAMAWYRKAADQGEAGAQNNIAQFYKNGQGAAKDDVQAVLWFRRAAEQGHMVAQFNLGIFYSRGEGGLEQDYTEAKLWYHKAAVQGEEHAQCNLAVMYHDGQGVSPDYARALEWYLRAANKGIDDAEFGIGVLYYNGQGVAQDYEKAVERFTKVAEKGHLKAKEWLKVEEERQRVLLEEKRKKEAFDPIRANVWLY